MASVQEAFASPVTFTLTLASLASSATAGRESTKVDNSANLYLDALVYVKVTLQAGTIGNDKAVYVYAYGSLDGTNFPDNVTGADAAITLVDPTNLRLIGVISAPAQSLAYDGVFSVAQAFGGILPPSWGIVIRNYTGIALSATENTHAYTYVGVSQTVT